MFKKKNDNETYGAISAVRHGFGTDKDKRIVRKAATRDDEVGQKAHEVKNKHEKGGQSL